jgi:hypothetical protein
LICNDQQKTLKIFEIGPCVLFAHTYTEDKRNKYRLVIDNQIKLCRRFTMTVQANLTAQQTQELATNALQALTLAQDAVNQAKALLEAGGVSSGAGGDLNTAIVAAMNNAAPAQQSTKRSTTSSGGRTASSEQLAIRELINQWCTKTPGLFTVNGMTKILGKDKIQVRNAINALTDVSVVRFAEKFQTSPGAREIIYKPIGFDAGV